MREPNEVFSLGTIFRLSRSGNPSETHDFYMLCVGEPHIGSFVLINLRGGSRLSEARRYEREITWENIMMHASYFIKKRCVLEPMKDCTISGTVMPSNPVTKVFGAPIGAEHEKNQEAVIR